MIQLPPAMTSHDRPTVLSVFTGPGGLDLGLEAAGFNVIGCIENDPAARQTLRNNRPHWPLIGSGDATDIAVTLKPQAFRLRRGELGILSGGPPCQPYSKAALWAPNGAKGLQDPRSNTLEAFLHLLESFLPKVVLIENVPEFVRGRTSALPTVRAALHRLNLRYGTHYRTELKIINAADYGVPQCRLRAILVAIRSGMILRWPEATHIGAPVRAWDAIGTLASSTAREATGRWATLLRSIPEGKNYLWHTPRGGGSALFGYRTRYWSFLLKLAKDKPAWTVPAQPGPATGPFHWENRPLSTDELLRLQTFPTTWGVAGNYRQQVKQLGNATPPLLAEVIGRAIGQQVFRLPYPSTPTFSITRKRSVPAPTRPTGVPRGFFQGRRTKPRPHPGEGLGPGSRRQTSATHARD